MSAKLLNLLTRVIGSQSYKLGQQGEYMYWSPFISHHKPKLQINIHNGNWHCWVSNMGGRNLFQLLSKVGASKEHFDELTELVDDVPRYKKNVKKNKKRQERAEKTARFRSIHVSLQLPVEKLEGCRLRST